MNLVSLLILPAIISLRHNDPARYAIAAVCLVILGIAITYSKLQKGTVTSGVEEPAAQAAEPATPASAARA
jgi:hypothetical protein